MLDRNQEETCLVRQDNIQMVDPLLETNNLQVRIKQEISQVNKDNRQGIVSILMPKINTHKPQIISSKNE